MDLRKNKIDATLIFLLREEGGKQKTLLAKKVRKIGVNRYNGWGGALKKRETPRVCAVRELKKESGLSALKRDLVFMGVVTFHNQRDDGSKFYVKVYIFLLHNWKGRLTPKEDEMRDPRWFWTKRLPLKRMMPGDIKFVPELLDGRHLNRLVKGEIWYSPRQEKLLAFKVDWVARTGDVD